jgi:hypothetical protein
VTFASGCVSSAGSGGQPGKSENSVGQIRKEYGDHVLPGFRSTTRLAAVLEKTVLGSHSPALTVIITGIFDEKWLLEIEATAAV